MFHIESMKSAITNDSAFMVSPIVAVYASMYGVINSIDFSNHYIHLGFPISHNRLVTVTKMRCKVTNDN